MIPGNHTLKVERWLENLLPEQYAIATICREMIWECVPQVTEKFSFGLPFYHYHGMFCYIRSVGHGIMIGFCRGKDLLLAFPQLEQGERKIVAGITLHTLVDVEALAIKQLIAGAALWQQEAAIQKIGFMHTAKRKR